MTKDEVVAALEEIGTLLELKGETGFRARAYLGAARALAEQSEDPAALVKAKRLGSVRGIGSSLEGVVTSLVNAGHVRMLDDLRAEVPAGMVELLKVPGLGAKKARTLYDTLGVDSVAALKAACEQGRVAGVKGFGEKTQARLLTAATFLGTVEDRALFAHTVSLADELLAGVRGLPGVVRAELVGSFRRRRETVGNVNLVAAAADPGPVLDAFAALPRVKEVLSREPDRVVVAAAGYNGVRKVALTADLRVVPDDRFAAAVVALTGSTAHADRLRARAADRGVSLDGPFADEADVYEALELHWLPPEMREDTGEIELAEARPAPKLIEPADVRGVFHNHTTASDGTASLEEMALAAKALGFEYFGVGDHSQSLTVANGLSPDRVRAQWAEADRLNAKLTGVRILKGTECDILADGSLDFPDALLAGFDYVVASVHSHFRLTAEEQTARVCKALAHPAVTWLGHPTGRLLLRREGYKLDLEKVLRTAAEHGKMVEINAQPDRLDLDWPYVKRARELGILLVINPDAHSPGELGLVRYGVNVARRGWLTAADVFNTQPLAEVMTELERRKAAWVK